MITYAQIAEVMLPKLDDDGLSDRYLPTQDIIPAINSAISRFQVAVGNALEVKKGSAEALRDMIKVRIWQTSSKGYAVLDDPLLSYTIANIVAVYAEPDNETTLTVIPGQPPAIPEILPLPPTTSRYRADRRWLGGGKPVREATHEQIPHISNSAALPGNEVLAANASRRTYSYFVNEGRVYVLPRSQASSKLIAIAHIQKYALLTSTASTVDLPEYLTELLAMWAVQFISIKQDPQMQGVGMVSSQDVAQLYNFLVK